MEGKTLLRAFIITTCVAFTALGFRNSNGDNSDAVAAASRAACGGDDCKAVLSQTARSSFGHEYSFTVDSLKPGKGSSQTVIIACKRELVMVGDWQCSPKP